MKQITIAAAVSLLITTSVSAQLFNDDFNDGNDTGWTRYSPLTSFGAPLSFSFPGGTTYRLQAPPSPSPAQLGQARGGSARNDQVFTLFEIGVDVVDWDNTLNQAFGVIGRGAEVGLGTTDGYAANYLVTGQLLQINRIANEAATTLAQTAVTLDPANDYRLVLTGVGSSLTATIANAATPGTILATVTASDSTFSSGVPLVFIFANTATGSADATFDNFRVAVPEPGAAAALSGLVCAALGLWRRQRARGC